MKKAGRLSPPCPLTPLLSGVRHNRHDERRGSVEAAHRRRHRQRRRVVGLPRGFRKRNLRPVSTAVHGVAPSDRIDRHRGPHHIARVGDRKRHLTVVPFMEIPRRILQSDPDLVTRPRRRIGSLHRNRRLRKRQLHISGKNLRHQLEILVYRCVFKHAILHIITLPSQYEKGGFLRPCNHSNYDFTVATNVLSATTKPRIPVPAVARSETVSVAFFPAGHTALLIVTSTSSTPLVMARSPAAGSIVASPVVSSSVMASSTLPLYQLCTSPAAVVRLTVMLYTCAAAVHSATVGEAVVCESENTMSPLIAFASSPKLSFSAAFSRVLNSILIPRHPLRRHAVLVTHDAAIVKDQPRPHGLPQPCYFRSLGVTPTDRGKIPGGGTSSDSSLHVSMQFRLSLHSFERPLTQSLQPVLASAKEPCCGLPSSTLGDSQLIREDLT